MAVRRTVEAEIRGSDKASPAIAKVSRAFNRMGRNLRREFGQAGRIVGRFASRTLVGLNRALLQTVKLTAAAGVGVAAVAVKTSSALESTATKVKSLSAFFGQSTDQIEERLKSIAIETGLSTRELGDALFNIGSAGFGGAKGFQILEDTAKGAVGTFNDVAKVSNSVVKLMRIFGEEAGTAEEILNVLKGTSDAASGEFEKVGKALEIGAQDAVQAGFDLKNYGAVLATLTTQFDTAEKAGDRFNELVRSIRRQADDLGGLTREQFAGDPVRFLQELQALGGADLFVSGQAAAAAGALIRNVGVLEKALENVKNPAEDINDLFDRASQTTAIRFGRLKQQLLDVLDIIGDGLTPAVNTLLASLNKFFIASRPRFQEFSRQLNLLLTTLTQSLSGVDLGDLAGALAVGFIRALGVAAVEIVPAAASVGRGIAREIGIAIAQELSQAIALAARIGLEKLKPILDVISPTSSGALGIAIETLKSGEESIASGVRNILEGGGLAPVDIAGRFDELGASVKRAATGGFAVLGEELRKIGASGILDSFSRFFASAKRGFAPGPLGTPGVLPEPLDFSATIPKKLTPQAESDIDKLGGDINKNLEKSISLKQETGQGVLSGLKTGFSSLFSSIVDGTITVKSAFLDLGKSVGQALTNIAAQLTATLLFHGSGLGGLFGLPNPLVAAAANGTVFPGGFKAFAGGSPRVSEPTLGLVGEGQFNEAIVPLPDGRRIPVEMRGGGGSTVVLNMNIQAIDSQSFVQRLAQKDARDAVMDAVNLASVTSPHHGRTSRVGRR